MPDWNKSHDTRKIFEIELKLKISNFARAGASWVCNGFPKDFGRFREGFGAVLAMFPHAFSKNCTALRIPFKIQFEKQRFFETIVRTITPSTAHTFFGFAQKVTKLWSQMSSTCPWRPEKKRRTFEKHVLWRLQKNILSTARWLVVLYRKNWK